MGMLDVNAKLASAQAVTSTGDTASSNVYDLGSANSSEMGFAEHLWVNAVVDTTATSGGSATLQAVLQDSADNSTFADIGMGPVVAVASLTVGTVLFQGHPPLGCRRYFRIVWRVGTAALTAGKFTAFLSNTVQRNVARPSGIPAVV